MRGWVKTFEEVWGRVSRVGGHFGSVSIREKE